ncbi:helix-turn-helix transcriptional regulator [Geosporobacter ferrireducens]|uniref:helix-turn-helix transcriptional regulator n=1 Tax=Geosporobacter ferrireducens TaxID=1424294 RepID=UPI00139F1DC1|nr:helix-turn-helix transcriptional regulator [Geosporobacter ferrireducens]MTI57283.1 helix-turn-helix transcriptional regulator [Geosporobacter ferrireducens]
MDKHAGTKHKTITFTWDIDENLIQELPEETLGERVLKCRKSMKLNMKELAKLCNISPFTIKNIESGLTYPNISTVKKLSEVFDVSIEYLMQINDLPEDTPGQIIKKYRLLKGLSQHDLARLCNIHQSTIKDYEDGSIKCFKGPTVEAMYKVLDYTPK